MNPTRAHDAAMQELAQRRIVALEDVQRFEKRFARVVVDLEKRTVTVVEREGRPWSAQWTYPDPTKPSRGTTEDRPHDLAAIIKAACRLVGFA